ncbi:MAG: Protein gp31 of His2 family of spindle-shaped halovirus [Candidatus Methanohalarchaeum thermophilum]|uniref:Protein gp31 of His2 family of spindle-shaped halovirus n=1 Tax=Methanohalarchaeum thermophilum TaxID=1903181 RepID=A0A1Q6DVB7_METT1|nr:MAG: Protein gp31 of His2 family of spindle-shaped halovirus [Candidatus Methanohalarchaeum thermophilum]
MNFDLSFLNELEKVLNDFLVYSKNNINLFILFFGLIGFILVLKFLNSGSDTELLDKSRRYGKGFKAWFLRNLVWLFVFGTFGLGLIVFELSNNEVVRTGYLFFVGLSPFTYLASIRIVDWLYERKDIPLLELKAEEDWLALWGLTPTQFRDLELRGKYEELGERRSESGNGLIYICRSFDPEELVAEGTWMGSMDDLELLENKGKVKELRETLTTEANKSISSRMQLSTNIKKSLKKLMAEYINKIEADTTFKGEEIDKTVQKTFKDLPSHKDTKNQQKPTKQTKTPKNPKQPKKTQNQNPSQSQNQDQNQGQGSGGG